MDYNGENNDASHEGNEPTRPSPPPSTSSTNTNTNTQNEMKKTKKQLMTLLLISGMLLTGTSNTLLNKYQDMTCLLNCPPSNPSNPSSHPYISIPDPSNGGREVKYEQPVWQTLQMFVGEVMCLFVFYLSEYIKNKKKKKNNISDINVQEGGEGEKEPLLLKEEEEEEVIERENEDLEKNLISISSTDSPSNQERSELSGWRNMIMLLPTVCDTLSTTLMNIGLLSVSASVYQMLRGAVVIFTGVLSVVVLGVGLGWERWWSLLAVMFGVGAVGASSILFPSTSNISNISNISNSNNNFIDETDNSSSSSSSSGGGGGGGTAMIGVLLIVMAQMISASQFVIEERILTRFKATPLKLVGLEGLFGCLITVTFMLIMHFLVGQYNERWEEGNYFNLRVGWAQFIGYRGIWLTSLLSALSVSFFNFFGLTITQYISATSRTTIDTCRTIFIWACSLYLGWERGVKGLQIVGFCAVIYGTFLFNGVVGVDGGLGVVLRALKRGVNWVFGRG